MSGEPQLFRVNPGSSESEKIQSVDFRELALRERQDIQEWVAANPDILEDNLLVVGKEFSGFDRTNERLDLLAVDSDGKLVVIELKRDDTGADVHWQAIKYASYLHRTTADEIVVMLANHENVSTEDARSKLVRHLGGDDLNALNNDQRIILASHRFAPEVTSAVLWLNEKVPSENLITCVTLTPYKMGDSIYIQASTIIPVPGAEKYVIGIGGKTGGVHTGRSSSLGDKLTAAIDRNRNDEVTKFLQKVGELTLRSLPEVIRPDKVSRWAGAGSGYRYYHFWYSKPPWSNWDMSYRINVWQRQANQLWDANVEFIHYDSQLHERLADIKLHQDQRTKSDGVNGFAVSMGSGRLGDDDFGERLATMARIFIEKITPIVNEPAPGPVASEDEVNEEDTSVLPFGV